MTKKKVMVVINSLHGGGAEQVMATILHHSKARSVDYDVAIVLLDRDHVAFPPPPWVRVHQLDCRFRTIASLIQLRRLVRAERPDITLSFLTRSNAACGFAMLGRRRPWIISERTNTAAHSGGGLRGWLTRRVVRMVYPSATAVIAVSNGVAASLERQFAVARSRIDVIPNPLDSVRIRAAAERDSPIRIDGPYIMALGRLVPVKRYSLLVRAFAMSGIPGQLVIAGEGPEAAAIRHLAARLGIAERVLLPGFLENPYPLLRRANLFALSSSAEGFPNALLEALALGVPVVATNCLDGPAEILAGKSAGESRGLEVAAAGILTPVGRVEHFAEALRMAHCEPLRSRMIANGLERARAYSADRAVERYWGVIDKALERDAPSRPRPAGR